MNLHPDLQDHLRDDGVMPVLHHPLVVTLFNPAVTEFINHLYEQKLRQVEEARQARRWARFVMLHERPYRLHALLEAVQSDHLPPNIYWPLVRDTWIDSENIRVNLAAWMMVWAADVPDRHHVMNQKERDALIKMPDHIEVWRGVRHEDAVSGMSWSNSRQRAEWFARRFDDRTTKPLLASGTIAKADVLAYFGGRGESEIVAAPENVKDVAVVRLRR